MGSRKWSKKIDTDPRSFRRPRGSKPPAKAILIVTEGEVTEPVYFDAVKRKLILPTVEIEVVGSGKGDPRRLAESAVKQRKERRKNARKGTLALSEASDFDELWIVFDTEMPVAQGRYHDGVAFAAAKGVKVAESTPCFEFWLLLHLDYTTAPMATFADVKPKLERALDCAYAKDARDSAALIPPLLAELKTACVRAEKIRIHHDEARTPKPANPSTEVDKLIAAIEAAASPANA
ncbi:MAG: RloB domain-containing protein [Opitutales bacterium]|nr:RloB domain-containing protein [Opitutales bacterium]